ncbi:MULTISPECIES: neprosin family prolyl endopeptidase [unclassified Xanthomonas]|uniref:neprosin family prolyl endopeptidase n=1 Tax=unclassified Xanthomonas TaxID=2643310 RepID=UPI002B234C5D|nr:MULTISPECIES: neprosin family prolyl endopeptidase [unclassified Xanthomonas]MEA9563975.1 neprosin family prolyl endopeptidase [Xanthomonas sp. WHRI 8932A]
MTFRSKRPMSIGRAVVALAICTAAPASLAGTLLSPSISAADDQRIDALMPPLLRTPATARVAPEQRAGMQHSTAAVSRAFPSVTQEFKQFLDAQAQRSYATREATAKVRDPAAFAQMQRYLFNRYNGLTVLRSVHQRGKVFDCIPLAQQPALRDGGALAMPPSIAAGVSSSAPLDAAQRCDAGSVPLQRIGLADMSQHTTLRAFLRGTTPQAKTPDRPTLLPAAEDAASVVHYYSTIYLDTAGSPVTGAGADLNTWVPAVRANDAQSISQIWLAGYTAQRQIQTLEAGWQTQPGAGWGNTPILFIYSTQDGYINTGCHNLDCADFVQTSTANVLGAAPAGGFSTAGGKQAMLHVEFQRNADGYWWFGLNGEWIGYYKAELYAGDIAEGSANIFISAGGEISTWDGRPSTPMGSGRFASAGYRQAAFQANHFYRDAAMATWPAQRLSSMSVEQPSCYTLAIAGYSYPYALGAGVSRTSLSPEMQNGGIYFGGPGCAR